MLLINNEDYRLLFTTLQTINVRIPTRQTMAMHLRVKDVRRKSVDLRLREALRYNVSHDVAEAKKSFVVEVGGPSVGERDEASGRNLTDEEARSQMRRSARTPELELRICRLAGVSWVKKQVLC